MTGKVVVTGMVLSATAIGETDKRVVILTKEHGKISAFAKGAKKPTSSLLACTNPFVFGEFELFVGRNSMTISKASVKNYFNEIQSDIEKIYYGLYALELADYYSRENNDDYEILRLLYQTIKAFCNGLMPNELIKTVYEMKMLVINGEYPDCFSCRSCGSTEDITGFSYILSGTVCNQCKSTVSDYIELDSSTIYALQFIINSKPEKLFSFNLSEKVFFELKRIVNHYLSNSVDVTLNSYLSLRELLEKPI